MNDQPPSAEYNHPSDQPPNNPDRQKPFQFGLKHLFLLTTMVALPCAFTTWMWDMTDDACFTVGASPVGQAPACRDNK